MLPSWRWLVLTCRGSISSGNTLIVAKPDRLFRSLRDVCTFVKELFTPQHFSVIVDARVG